MHVLWNCIRLFVEIELMRVLLFSALVSPGAIMTSCKMNRK